MSYIGRDIRTGAFRQLDDISSGFDGSDTTHTMQVNSTNVSVGDVNQILLSLGGVIQKPGTDFTVSGSVLTFTTAPAANTSFFAILLGSDNGGTVTPTDGSVTGDKVASTGAFTIGAAGTASSLAGIPFYNGDTTSIYTHDVSGTDDTASNNTAYGIAALDAVTQADNAVCIGYNAGTAITTGGNNTIMGSQAGEALTSGGSNLFIGRQAGDEQDTENHNVGVGRNALGGAINGGEYNTAIGNNTLDACTSGDYNVAVGYDAGTDLTTGERNTFIGHEAGKDCIGGGQNVAIGDAAGSGALSASAGRNIMIGRNAGQSMTSTTGNTVIGYEAGRAQNYDGAAYVTMVGYQAGEDQTTSAYNTGFGAFNQRSSDTETHNTSIGYYTMQGANGGGEYNTALGSYVLSNSSQSGDNNVGIGHRTFYDATTAANSVAVGYYCLQNVTEGQANTAVGKNVYEDLTTGDYNTGIGGECEVSSADAQHQITIGYGLGSNGDNNFTFGKSGNRVYNNFTSNASWTRSSDERKKRNIKDDNLGLDFINELRTVTFQWKPSNEFPKEWDEYSEENHMDTEVVMHGLIAQEVKSALDKAGVDTFGGWTENTDGMQNISREMFVFPLIKAVQELSKEIKKLKEDK